MPKKSEIAKRANWRCPYCGQFLGVLVSQRSYFDKDGHHIRIVSGPGSKAAFEGCGKCGKQWPLWKDYEQQLPSPDISVVETSRSEEFIGNETRHIENRTPATVQRTLHASKEWTYQVEIDITDASLRSSASGLEMKGVSFTSQIQNTLTKRYNISMGETKRLEEEVIITVPENTSVTAIFAWKRIWQNGYVELEETRIPFKLCVGITFDLRQE